MNKKVSVIIPVYNTEKELRRCLDSIVNQTYTNLEIICVDDGSTDGSEKIVDEYSLSDNRVIVIHQENHGESNARNVGLQNATGDYIAFCDCDDWIDPQMYQVMVAAMEQYDVDLVATSWYRETEDESIRIQNNKPVCESVISRNCLLRYIYERDSYRGFAYMWNKLYKKEILQHRQKGWIKFNEEIELGGDVIYLAEAALNVTNAVYLDNAFYHYNQRMNSGCHTTNLKKLRDWVRSYEIVLERFEEEEIDKEIVDYVKRFLAYHSYNGAKEAWQQINDEYLKEFQRLMRKYENEYIELNAMHSDRVVSYLDLLAKNICE